MDEQHTPKLSLKERVKAFEQIGAAPPPSRLGTATAAAPRQPSPRAALRKDEMDKEGSLGGRKNPGLEVTSSRNGLSSSSAAASSAHDGANSSPRAAPQGGVKDILTGYHTPPSTSTKPATAIPNLSRYPPLSPTLSTGSHSTSPAKSRSASPAPASIGLEAFSAQLRPRAGSGTSVLSAASGSGSFVSAAEEFGALGDARGRLARVETASPDSMRSVGRNGITQSDPKLRSPAPRDDDALMSFNSPVMGTNEGWTSSKATSKSLGKHPLTNPGTPPLPDTPKRTVSTSTQPDLPPRLPPRRAETLDLAPSSSPTSAPSLPPRPRIHTRPSHPPHSPSSHPPHSSPTIPSRSSTISTSSPSYRARVHPPSSTHPRAHHNPAPSNSSTSSLTSSTSSRHSRHTKAQEGFESISLSSDGASSLLQSLSTSLPPTHPAPPRTTFPPTPSRRPLPPSTVSSAAVIPSHFSTLSVLDPVSLPPPGTPKRRPIDPRSKARYGAYFERLVEGLGREVRPAWVKGGRLEGAVVKVVWERSRLESTFLRGVWAACDTEERGVLDKEEFMKGLWMIDEELKRCRVGGRSRRS